MTKKSFMQALFALLLVKLVEFFLFKGNMSWQSVATDIIFFGVIFAILNIVTNTKKEKTKNEKTEEKK